jgi:hypothetical protein
LFEKTLFGKRDYLLPGGPHGVAGTNFNRFTPIAGTGTALTPPTESDDPKLNLRGFVLKAVNEIRSWFTTGFNTLSTTAVAVVNNNGVIEV